ncbi:MAG: fructose-bisphosphatase class I [Acidobacteria bacterium]|nr:MAG: fructose-bisphosphatase class I [Acidobacteriota bacterium]
MTSRTDLSGFLKGASVQVDLTRVLLTAARGGVRISRELRRAGLSGETGATGDINVQGEAVKKMDVIANQILVEAFSMAGDVAWVASEEMEEPLALRSGAPYSVLFDPLDGSSSVDTGGSVGSIVSIQRAPHAGGDRREALLQRGSAQSAACYINYGPATTLVLTTGSGAHLFCLDPESEDFILSAQGLRIPEKGKLYATNEGQRTYYHLSTRRLLDFLQTPDRVDGRPYSTRYSGCLVTDVHRILLEGGIYLYPADTRDPKKAHGKLRLLYECAPLAMVVEQAGGKASTGLAPILEVQPTEIHQRVPLYIGSPREVSLAEEFEMGKR